MHRKGSAAACVSAEDCWHGSQATKGSLPLTGVRCLVCRCWPTGGSRGTRRCSLRRRSRCWTLWRGLSTALSTGMQQSCLPSCQLCLTANGQWPADKCSLSMLPSAVEWSAVLIMRPLKRLYLGCTEGHECVCMAFRYHRMDGSTNVGVRARLVDDFNSNEGVFLFLLTTKVGGLGINLTGADRCASPFGFTLQGHPLCSQHCATLSITAAFSIHNRILGLCTQRYSVHFTSEQDRLPLVTANYRLLSSAQLIQLWGLQGAAVRPGLEPLDRHASSGAGLAHRAEARGHGVPPHHQRHHRGEGVPPPDLQAIPHGEGMMLPNNMGAARLSPCVCAVYTELISIWEICIS